MQLTIAITGADGTCKATISGQDDVTLVYSAPYTEGDSIQVTSDSAGYIVALLEDSMSRTFGYLNGTYLLHIPFEEKRVSYSPKSFTGEIHLLQVRTASTDEISTRKNLCLNPLDSHENTGFFPHAKANVETRGEAVFAARNAIDGHVTNDGHGPWPYQSWGINRDPDAELTVDFGRDVSIDTLIFTLRADFPHDNWWNTATVTFSDGTKLTPQFHKTGRPQAFPLPTRIVRWLTLSKLIQDGEDPSPFPALTQIEAWGKF